jgi:hypothetical protein
MLPYFSLAALLFSYGLLGSSLSAAESWASTVDFVLIAIVLMLPRRVVNDSVERGLRSQIGSFLGLILSASLISIVVLWAHVYVQFLLVILAEVVVRIDLQRLSMASRMSWLRAIALFGLGVGWLVA